MMTVMWLWIFYRAKEDGAYMLGFGHPWDHHHGHGHDDHDEDEDNGHGHGHSHGDNGEWVKTTPGARPVKE